MTSNGDDSADRDSPATIFLIFLRLGLTSFGGPVAHIGFFRIAFVEQRRWLTDKAYAELVALCQFLPGPASSQVGMGLGLMRGGLQGMAAAWLGFTLPSALLLAGFAMGLAGFGLLDDAPWIAGIKAAVVAVVVQALAGMAKSLTPDAPRASIAALALAAALLLPGGWAQIGAIALAAVFGLAVPDRVGGGTGTAAGLSIQVPRILSSVCLAAFLGLLIALPLLAALDPKGIFAAIDAFYRAGALVFGGGHVVLPLLEGELVDPGLIDRDAFLAGYAGAQVVPGPMFTIAAHLGALADIGPGGALGALIATVAIFLPSALLMLGALPHWTKLSESTRSRGALAAVNAAVVGLLGAALYDPVSTQGIDGAPTLVLAVASYIALTQWKVPVWAVVPAAGGIGALLL